MDPESVGMVSPLAKPLYDEIFSTESHNWGAAGDLVPNAVPVMMIFCPCESDPATPVIVGAAETVTGYKATLNNSINAIFFIMAPL
jgi:hypothetical protein